MGGELNWQPISIRKRRHTYGHGASKFAIEYNAQSALHINCCCGMLQVSGVRAAGACNCTAAHFLPSKRWLVKN
jgi:hypothetical protein